MLRNKLTVILQLANFVAISTFVIIAKGIKSSLSSLLLINDDASRVLRTIFMVVMSEDGNARILDPTVPEWTQHGNKTAIQLFTTCFGVFKYRHYCTS